MSDDEIARLRRENDLLRHEHEILVWMVKRAVREVPSGHGKDILADLAKLLAAKPGERQ